MAAAGSALTPDDQKTAYAELNEVLVDESSDPRDHITLIETKA